LALDAFGQVTGREVHHRLEHVEDHDKGCQQRKRPAAPPSSVSASAGITVRIKPMAKLTSGTRIS
jgi:hypothetical protein